MPTPVRGSRRREWPGEAKHILVIFLWVYTEEVTPNLQLSALSRHHSYTASGPCFSLSFPSFPCLLIVCLCCVCCFVVVCVVCVVSSCVCCVRCFIVCVCVCVCVLFHRVCLLCVCVCLFVCVVSSCVCCCCCCCSDDSMMCVCPQQHSNELAREPSTTKNSSSSRAPKTGAQLRDNRRSAKNDAKCVKNPTHRVHNWSVHDSGDELNLRHFHCATVAV